MIVTESRLAAKSAESRPERSTSPEARRKSAANSRKHGLTGAGLVMPEDDALEIQNRFQDYLADMKPRTKAGVDLIYQIASLSFRADRAVAIESALIAKNVRHAAQAHDEERIREAEDIFARLPENPRSALRQLRLTPEGVELVFNAWHDLRSDLLIEPKAEWSEGHLEQAANLMGLKARHARGSRIGALSRAFWGDFAAIKDDEAVGLDAEFRREWAKSALLEEIDAEIAELEEHYETLDFEMIELDRQEAGARALFDMSKEATLARRYEGELRRAYYKALKEFRQVEEESAAQAAASPPCPMPPPPPSNVSSFRETSPPAPFDPFRVLAELPMGEGLLGPALENDPPSPGRPPKKAG